MHRLAKFQHYIVGYVNNVAYRAHTAGTQVLLHPFRAGPDFNVFQYAHCKTAAQIFGVNFNGSHISSTAAGSFLNAHIRHAQFFAKHGSSFARQADNIGAVAAVGGKVNVKYYVVKAEHFFNIHANRSIRRQDENAFALFRQQKFGVNAKFSRAAQHTKRIKAAHFCFFKRHAVWQMRADNCYRHHIILMNVLRTG